MIDRSCHAARGKRQTSLFAVSQMRSVGRIISSGDVVARGFECRFANNIIYFRSLSLPIRELDYTHGRRNPEVLVQFTGNLGHR